MNKKKLLGLTLAIVVSAGLFVGCDVSSSNDTSQATQTETLQKQSSSKLGMPNIKNFYEKQTLKNIMEACDDSKLITYAYTKNDYTGKFTYIGQTMGYGIPYGTEYTSPEKLSALDYHDSTPLPQADPNGLYKATNVSATWIMLIDPKTGKANPMYFESDLTVLPTKLPKNLLESFSIPSNY